MPGFVIPTYTFRWSQSTPKYSYLGQGLWSTKSMQRHLILCHILQPLGIYLKQPSNVPISSGEQTPKSQHWQTYTMLANTRQEISYLHLLQRSRPPSSQVQTCFLWRAILMFAFIVLNVFVLCFHIWTNPNTCALSPLLGHGWLGQELSWKTEVWQQPIFQAGNIPNWGTGGRRAKTKSSWKLPSLCYFHHVERWRARFRFLSSMPLVSHKDLSGLLNVEASEAELMHPVGLGSMGWG